MTHMPEVWLRVGPNSGRKRNASYRYWSSATEKRVSNSWVHQIVIRGTLGLSLEDEPFNEHPVGSIVAVPFDRKMEIRNRGREVLEFFVVKAPNPRDMPATKAI